MLQSEQRSPLSGGATGEEWHGGVRTGSDGEIALSGRTCPAAAQMSEQENREMRVKMSSTAICRNQDMGARYHAIRVQATSVGKEGA